MKKKVISILLCVGLVASMVVGCGGSKKADGDSKSKGGDKLVYWSMWEATEPQGKAIKAAIDAYTKETGVEVDVQFKGRTGIREGLQPALDAGTNIDLFDEDIDRVNDTWGKYLMDLEDLAKENDYEATANPGLIAACKEKGDGTLKSIPYQPNVFAFFYNQDLFDKAGIKETPQTWAEFLDVCQKLKDAGITPMTMDDAYATSVIGYHLGRLVGEDGVRAIVNDGKWDDPAVAQMAKDYAELASKGYFSENVGSNVWPAGQNSELATGEVAMYLNGSWLPNEVKDIAGENFNWGCFAYPAVDGGKTGIETNNFGAQVFAINKDSKKGKEAFALIEKITKGEFDKQLSDDSIGIPADTTNSEWPALVSCAKPVMEGSTARFTWAVGVESNENMTPVIKENFIKLMAGTQTADEFVKAMQDASK
ncbi:ABC transporter substrate-binding protein [Lachnospiraceae bacterium LCP25S3_G4]